MEDPNNTMGMVQICAPTAEVSVAVTIVVFCPQSALHLWWPSGRNMQIIQTLRTKTKMTIWLHFVTRY